MATPPYKPVKKNRLFSRATHYSEINWNDFDTVIQQFRKRIETWYIEPIRQLQACGDFSFPVAGLTCLLIDMLSQYFCPPQPPIRSQRPGRAFKEFIRIYIPKFAGPMPTCITHHRQDNNDHYSLTKLEDVIYHALRCGILHEAHATLYTVIDGLKGKRFKYYKRKCTKYGDGTACLTVVIDPHMLLADTLLAFEGLLAKLSDPSTNHDSLRACFKAKFLKSFGIDIGNETT